MCIYCEGEKLHLVTPNVINGLQRLPLRKCYILFCAMAVPPRDEKSKKFPLYICSDVNVLPFILSLYAAK